MIATRRHRTAILCVLACALLATAVGGAPSAGATAHRHTAAALAQERYYSSYGDSAPRAALAQERYYSSYGAPEQLSVPGSRAPADDTPWLEIAAAAAALGLTALSGTQLRRVRSRRRAARVVV